jgi:putative nucleotidyltransferase with HDIG domain
LTLTTIKTIRQGAILIVDDDLNVQQALEVILECEGYRCQCVDTIPAAAAVLEGGGIDLVLTDLYLKSETSTGMELIDITRRLDETIPVILLTGFPTIKRAVEAMRRGAVDFMTKPFDRDLMLHQVAKALQERLLRTENQRLQAEVNKTAVIEKLNRELHNRVSELTQLYTISEGLNEFMDTPALFDRIARVAQQVTRAQRVSVMVLDRTRCYLRIRSALGVPPEVMATALVKVGEGIAGRVVASGRPIRVSDWIGEQYWTRDRPQSRGYRTHSWLSLPLRVGREIFGVINITDKMDGGTFTRADEQIMLTLVEKAGSKLENQALYEGIYANLVDTLTSLVSTIEAKDPYTRQHSQRVTEYAMALAEHMELPTDKIEMINFAGMLHDIGKIGVNDGILTKPGRLTPEEYNQIKEHPLIGERIVEPLGLLMEERGIIRSHHERWDGRGYPDGLAGEEIPLLARVLAVTDAFDAMTTTRSYRQAMSVEAALSEMMRCCGTQFDPTICRMWVEGLKQGTIKWDDKRTEGLSLARAASA